MKDGFIREHVSVSSRVNGRRVVCGTIVQSTSDNERTPETNGLSFKSHSTKDISAMSCAISSIAAVENHGTALSFDIRSEASFAMTRGEGAT